MATSGLSTVGNFFQAYGVDEGLREGRESITWYSDQIVFPTIRLKIPTATIGIDNFFNNLRRDFWQDEERIELL